MDTKKFYLLTYEDDDDGDYTKALFDSLESAMKAGESLLKDLYEFDELGSFNRAISDGWVRRTVSNLRVGGYTKDDDFYYLTSDYFTVIICEYKIAKEYSDILA